MIFTFLHVDPMFNNQDSDRDPQHAGPNNNTDCSLDIQSFYYQWLADR